MPQSDPSSQFNLRTAPRPTANLGRLFWLLLAIALLLPVAAMMPRPVEAARSCTGASTSRPPSTIRVLTRDGTVEKVDFRRYVGIVMASGEWPSKLPKAMLEAGAVAVKQFAWFHSLKGNHRRGFVTAGGKCYDVLSSTRDQLYRPSRASVSRSQRNAIDATWRLSVIKNGRFMITQYNSGSSSTKCGSDANGRVIRQRSARDCARDGYSARQILRTYYGPGVSFNGRGGGSDDRPRDTARSTPSPTPRSTPRSTPRPTSGERERERQTPRPTPRPTPTPTPAPELVAWWEVALGEEPELGQAVEVASSDGRLAAALPGSSPEALGSTDDESRSRGEVRINVSGGIAEAFRPVIAPEPPLAGEASLVPLLSPAPQEGGAADQEADAEWEAGESAGAMWTTGVSFVGRSMTISGVPGPESSVVNVYVDGELTAMVDLHWAEPYSEVVIFSQEWRKSATHTVKLLMVGASEQLRIELDAEVVYY